MFRPAAGEAVLDRLAKPGVLSDEALKITARGLPQVRRIRSLDQPAEPDGILEDVAWYVRHEQDHD